MDEAKYTHRHHQRVRAEPWYRLSVWADTPLPGEATDETLLRLIHAAGLGRIRLEDVRNERFWWTSAQAIYDAGFDMLKDNDTDERPEHYSVTLGDELSRSSVEDFVAVFGHPVGTKEFIDGSASADQPESEVGP